MLTDFDGVIRHWPAAVTASVVVNSSAVGCAKPSRRFYEHAARRCGCEPRAVLFVDDRAENVDAAIDFGFHSHLHHDSRTLERLLREWNLTGEEV